MSRRPSNADLARYLDGESVADVESWLNPDAETDADQGREPLPGSIGGYRVERELGRGGMGVVITPTTTT